MVGRCDRWRATACHEGRWRGDRRARREDAGVPQGCGWASEPLDCQLSLTGDPQQYRTPPFPQTFTRSDSVEFSRDGTQIAVLVERQEGPSFSSELWVIPYPSGTPRRVLTRARDISGGRISWLPDNRHIVIGQCLS